MLSWMSRRWDWASLKGKDGLAKGTGSDWLPHPVGGGEIDFAAEEVGEAALESSYGDEGDAPGAIEVGEQIDIGVRVCFAARNRSEETQMDEPSDSNSGAFVRRTARMRSLSMSEL